MASRPLLSLFCLVVWGPIGRTKKKDSEQILLSTQPYCQPNKWLQFVSIFRLSCRFLVFFPSFWCSLSNSYVFEVVVWNDRCQIFLFQTNVGSLCPIISVFLTSLGNALVASDATWELRFNRNVSLVVLPFMRTWGNPGGSQDPGAWRWWSVFRIWWLQLEAHTGGGWVSEWRACFARQQGAVKKLSLEDRWSPKRRSLPSVDVRSGNNPYNLTNASRTSKHANTVARLQDASGIDWRTKVEISTDPPKLSFPHTFSCEDSVPCTHATLWPTCRGGSANSDGLGLDLDILVPKHHCICCFLNDEAMRWQIQSDEAN